jgi:hypothetical protein
LETLKLTKSTLPKLKLKPRLHTLGTGLVNYASNMVKDLLTAHNIAIRVYQGEYLVQKAKTIAGKETHPPEPAFLPRTPNRTGNG